MASSDPEEAFCFPERRIFQLLGKQIQVVLATRLSLTGNVTV